MSPSRSVPSVAGDPTLCSLIRSTSPCTEVLNNSLVISWLYVSSTPKLIKIPTKFSSSAFMASLLDSDNNYFPMHLHAPGNRPHPLRVLTHLSLITLLSVRQFHFIPTLWNRGMKWLTNLPKIAWLVSRWEVGDKLRLPNSHLHLPTVPFCLEFQFKYFAHLNLFWLMDGCTTLYIPNILFL